MDPPHRFRIAAIGGGIALIKPVPLAQTAPAPASGCLLSPRFGQEVFAQEAIHHELGLQLALR